jgi:hypothetical protein
LQNPKWDDYFNTYMEESQKKINFFILVEEFNKLQFHYTDTPAVIIDFIDYISGIKGYYMKALTQNLNKPNPAKKDGLISDRSNEILSSIMGDDD